MASTISKLESIPVGDEGFEIESVTDGEFCGGLSVELGINPAKDIPDIPKSTINLDEKSKLILGCIEKDPGVSARSISENTGISINTVERRLKKMTEQGLLRREGSTKSGKWIIVHVNL